MTFNRLNQEDIELILALQKDNFPDGWNKSQLLSGFNGGGLQAVSLEVEQKKVGYISYTLGLDSADIESVVVVSSERKKGYGKLLLEYALKELGKSGCEKALLEVRESNRPAISLYKSCGFSEIAVRKKYYLDGENALIFIKYIKEN